MWFVDCDDGVVVVVAYRVRACNSIVFQSSQVESSVQLYVCINVYV